MAPQSLHERGSPSINRPSPFQFALALAIGRTKPDGLSIRGEFVLTSRVNQPANRRCNNPEYILRLRQHVLRDDVGKRSGHLHIDRDTYWRDLYERSQAEKAELRTRAFELERKNDALEARLKTAASSADRPSTSRKRKADPSGDAVSGVPAKRSKATKQTSAADNGHETHDTFDEDLDLFNLAGDAGTKTAQGLYQLHKLYQQAYPDSAVMAHHLIQVSTGLATIISSACKQHQRPPSASTSTTYTDRRSEARKSMAPSASTTDIAPLFRAAARVLTSLLHGLTKISTSDSSSSSSSSSSNSSSALHHESAVVYAYVQTFTALLDTLTTLSHARAELELAAAATAASSTTSRKPKPKPPSAKEQQSIPRTLTALLTALLSHLSPAEPAHAALFEGLLFTILQRTGARLFALTFGRARSDDVEHDIAPAATTTAAPPPASPTERAPSTAPPPPPPTAALAARAARIEAPHLLAVFERAMALAPWLLRRQHPVPARPAAPLPGSARPAARPRAAAGAGRSAPGKMSLALWARERLQRTLVRAVFGEDGGGGRRGGGGDGDGDDDDDDDDDDGGEVGGGLRAPAPVRLGPLAPAPRVRDEDVAEWFGGEVWRVLGWEILGREGDW